MVTTDVNTVTYNGDGSTTAFPFTFKIQDASEINLQLVQDDDTVTDITSDFYVDTVNSTVYYPGYAPGAEPPEADQPPKVQTGQKLTIWRDVPMTQENDLGDKWPFHEIEDGLDKLTMIAQQIYSYTNRKLDAALASMFQLAGIVTDSDKLQHITDQYNAIDANAAAAAESEENAAASAAAAANSATASAASATSSANSANAADATATALTNFLDTKETLTAPAVDPALVIGGAAADAKVTGSLIESYKKQNGYVAGALYLDPNDWENGNIAISTSGWTYAATPKRTHTKQGVTYTLKFGDKVCMTDWTGKRLYIGWDNGTAYKTAGWLTSDYTVTEDGQYVFNISTNPEVAQDNVYNLLSSFYIISGNSLSKDAETAKMLAQCSVTEVAPASADVIDGYSVYGDTGVASVNANYTCTDFIAIPKPYMGSNLVTYCTLLSNIGLSFYDKDKKFISGYSGTLNPTLEGTSKKLLPIPNGAEYVRSTLVKTAYNSPSDFTMSYVSASWFSQNNIVQLTANDMQLGNIDASGNVVLTNSARSVTPFIKLNSGDKITTTNIRFSIFEYDEETLTLRTSTSGTWVNSYTVQNDCYARLLYLSNDFSASITDTVFNTKGRVLTKQPTILIAKDVATLYGGQPQKPGIIHGGVRATGNYSYISAAHRGYNMAAPENTLPAFKMAREKGFEWVETDIQFTSDGVPVLLHDWTVDRTSNGTGKITDMTYAEAEALDFGSWKSPYFANTRILKLDDFLRFCRNVGLNAALEFKPNVPYTTAQLRTIFDLVKKYHMADNVLWIPTGYITETLTEFPKAKVCLSVNSAITQPSVDQAVSLQTESNTVYILTPCTLNDDTSIAIAEASNVPVIYWNIQTEANITSASPYVSGFITDGVFPNDVLYKVGMNM